VPFAYEPSAIGALRQGELLENVWWHQPLWPASPIPEGTSIEIEPVHHPLVIVIHQDCDLERDYDLRIQARTESREPQDDAGRLLPQVLCCDAFTEDEVRVRASGIKFARLKDNQVERFHYLPSAIIAGTSDTWRESYLDFRGVFSVFTTGLYLAIEQGTVRRLAVVPPVYLQDLTHRVFGFLSRVALPT
jgi:hypothetical protein